MATRAKTRKNPIAPTKKASAREKAVSVSAADDVTRRLASTLTISNRKGVGTEYSGAPESIENRRISIMRAVNSASQKLAAVTKSGWKAPSVEPSGNKSTTALHEAFGLATSARSALADLRVISPEDVDVERAANSVAGKLLSLDMVSCRFISFERSSLVLKYSHALGVLSDMHCRLVAFLRPDLTPPIFRPNSQVSPPLRDLIAVISLPLPTQSSKPLDPTLLLLISTYLSHSLIALSHCFSSSSLKRNQHETLVLYSQALHDSPSLLSWTPLCTQLPEKQCDVLLTRVYTALTSISSQVGTAEAVFRIRSYALMCLLRTSGSTIGSKTFWDQVVKSASSFTKSASSNDKGEERRLCRIVTSAFSEILALAEERGNRDEFLHGMPFISFCDAWISYSKSVSNYPCVPRPHLIVLGRRCRCVKQGDCIDPIIALNIHRGL
jgi:separase